MGRLGTPPDFFAVKDVQESIRKVRLLSSPPFFFGRWTREAVGSSHDHLRLTSIGLLDRLSTSATSVPVSTLAFVAVGVFTV